MVLSKDIGAFEQMKPVFGVSRSTDCKLETMVCRLKKAGVNAVFVDQDRELIEALKKAGIRVFFSVNVFGGSDLWEKHPDLRPITDQGTPPWTRWEGTGGLTPQLSGIAEKR